MIKQNLTYIIWSVMKIIFKNDIFFNLLQSSSVLCRFIKLYKYISGMLPHKTERGKQALRKLKAYEGIPPPYDRRKRVVVPGALRVVCLKPGRKVSIGSLCFIILICSYCDELIFTYIIWFVYEMFQFIWLNFVSKQTIYVMWVCECDILCYFSSVMWAGCHMKLAGSTRLW